MNDYLHRVLSMYEKLFQKLSNWFRMYAVCMPNNRINIKWILFNIQVGYISFADRFKANNKRKWQHQVRISLFLFLQLQNVPDDYCWCICWRIHWRIWTSLMSLLWFYGPGVFGILLEDRFIFENIWILTVMYIAHIDRIDYMSRTWIAFVVSYIDRIGYLALLYVVHMLITTTMQQVWFKHYKYI